MKQFLLFLSLVVVLGLTPALAQPGYFGPEPWRPTGSFGGGFATPVNPLANRLNTGWNMAGGIGVTQNYFGVTVDAMFNDFGINSRTLAQVGARSGSQKFWAVTVDPTFHVNDRGPLDFYVIGGAGFSTGRIRNTGLHRTPPDPFSNSVSGSLRRSTASREYSTGSHRTKNMINSCPHVVTDEIQCHDHGKHRPAE